MATKTERLAAIARIQQSRKSLTSDFDQFMKSLDFREQFSELVAKKSIQIDAGSILAGTIGSTLLQNTSKKIQSLRKLWKITEITFEIAQYWFKKKDKFSKKSGGDSPIPKPLP